MELVAMGPAKALEEGIIALKDYNRVKLGINAYKLDKQTDYEHPEVRGIWLWGESGTGKSHDARHKYAEGTVYIKPLNKWFDGYNGEETIILDDLDDDQWAHDIKIWLDHYACKGEVKGGTVPLGHKRFIITSNQSIEQYTRNKPECTIPILRRCQVHHYTQPFKHDKNGLAVVHTD